MKSGFQIIIDQVVWMADKVGCTVSGPRAVGRQQHQSNISSATPIEHYEECCHTISGPCPLSS